MKQICVFCGSGSGARAVYTEAAQSLAAALIRRHLGLVYGGSNIGLMKTIADTMLLSGAEVTGVIPHSMVRWEVAHEGLTTLHVVDSMHERKALMAELSAGFIALPGGMGTFDELCEILTWAQLGIHRKPVGLLNVEGYYDPLLAMFDHAAAEGFIKPAHRALLLTADHPDTLLDLLAAHQPGAGAQWVAREQA
ncbi:MAG: TIGR00730 family Rossman fold protein [Blastocatellia bacterium]